MAATGKNLKNYLPPIHENGDVAEVPHLRVSSTNTAQTWGGAGVSTTKTVTDSRVKADSVILVQATGSVAQIGLWRISTRTANTSFVITSTDAEQAGLTFEYLII